MEKISREGSLNRVEVDAYLLLWHEGDSDAYNKVMELLHQDLQKIAHRLFGHERRDHTMQTNDLVNQLYIKLLRAPNHHWKEHAHFLNAAARAMRQILIDHARKWNCRAHGKGKVALEDRDQAALDGVAYLEQMLNVDQIVERLEQIDPATARIADLKMVLGLTLKEISEELKLDLNKVKREWIFIKKFIMKSMGQEEN